MTERIIIAGSGGQGIMLLGKVLAEGALLENKFVTWLPAYGPEVRGGAAHCMVTISDDEIGSAHIDQADSLIIMNQVSLDKFKGRLKNTGLMIVNSSLTKPDKNIKVNSGDFTDTAIGLGNIKVANIVALGCYLAVKKIVSPENILKVIRKMAPRDKPELLKANIEALKKGMEFKND
ncbi:MAG: 2-oxoacid:acceptor oxidoreductase family protein [Candidatus Omnitrophica bacterium]|nr:2-oxoacid:acceptor oxidoreductase family protein [Candidatus Omnitrophota bacterium]MDD5027282.1 2-oxoacid:acceptor oxidoreductase family protein [Candidatus Omnitrophota bacterium]MDD5661545.1 2-oxoacid:acceptor oxidoreductase family protein [Candidatus Omnitrophota bacterium]